MEKTVHMATVCTSEPLHFFFLWFLLICDPSRLTPEIKYYFNEINRDIDPE